MPRPDESLVSRRRWLGLAATPALAATFGAVALGGSRILRAGEMASGPANDLGLRSYNIRDFGAVGDGHALDSPALQAAIDACTRDGGGTVLVPAGTFLIGPVELKSNVTLHLAAAGQLLGSTTGSLYRPVDRIPLEGDWTLEDGNHALLYGVEAKNVTIEGPGKIDGQGIAFFNPVRGQLPPSGLGGNNRPYLLLFYRCENLTVRDIDLFNSAYHCLRIIQSAYVRLAGIHIYNRDNRNADGLHFISATHVTVADCHIECQDDACALFGSCQFIHVTNSSFSTRWSVFRFGGGVAQNVTVSNCLLYDVYGCPIKLHCMPGSRFENFSFSNLVLQNVTGPINISEGPAAPRPVPPGQSAAPRKHRDDSLPCVVRNIAFTNIHGTVTTNPPQLAGTPFHSDYNAGETHSCIGLSAVGNAVLEQISFDNIHLTFGGGGTAEDAARRTLPEFSGEYFAWGAMPAYGLYARNARGLTLNNLRFETAEADRRPAVILDHVSDAALNALSLQGHPEAESVVRLVATQDVLFSATRLLTPAAVFLEVEGPASQGIMLDGGDLSKARAALALRDGASDAAVKIRS